MYRRQSEHVLLIDNDQEFAERLATSVGHHGLRATIASSGEEGLRRALAHPPVLVVIAVELSGECGFALNKSWTRHKELQPVPVVLLSSSPDAVGMFEQHRKLRVRAAGYAIKPIDPSALALEIRRILSEKNAEPSAKPSGLFSWFERMRNPKRE